jgi:TonB family protein
MKKITVPRTGGGAEGEAVRTTVVGGRPPGKSAIPRHIPRGLEVLVKKAAVDPAFKKLLFEKRAEAAKAIGLKLNAAEEAMLTAVPLPQLEGIIAYTRVAPKLRPAFLGYAAGAMLLVVGVAAIEYGLGRYCTDRSPNELELLARTLDAYPVRYESSPQPIPGLSEAVSFLTKGKSPHEKYLVFRAFHRFFRTDISFPVENTRSPYFESPSGAWLADSHPTSIKGSAAGHPARSPDAVGTVFRKYSIGVYKAYTSARAKNPSLAGGKFVVEITILADGTVGDAHVISDTLGDAVFRRSLLARIRNWRFPPVEEGTVTVVYPFVFVAKHDDDEE